MSQQKSDTRIEDLCMEIARLQAINDDLLESLKEIRKGEGRFNPDKWEHACNTIEDMRHIAITAIAKAKGAP